MPSPVRFARYVLWVHVVVAAAASVPLLFFAGRAARRVEWVPLDPTMAKMLGAALLALAVGSLLAARDPLRHRVIVQMEIVYTALSAAVLAYRLLRFPALTPDIAWVWLALFALFCLLFSVTYPRAAR